MAENFGKVEKNLEEISKKFGNISEDRMPPYLHIFIYYF